MFTLLLLLLLTGPDEPITASDRIDQQTFPLNSLVYFEDTSAAMTFQEVRDRLDLFGHNPAYTIQQYRPSSAYWIRFPLRLPADSEKQWLLEFYDQTIDDLRAYVPDQQGGYAEQRLGDGQPFGQRRLAHKNFELLARPAADTVQTYYFRVQSRQRADVRVVLRSFDRFVYYALNEYFLFGIFYGMIVIISLYNVLMFLAIRKRQYLTYVCYVLSVGLYAASVDGLGFQYLWPQRPHWNLYAPGVALFLVIFWSLVFARQFLHTRIRAPQLNAWLGWAIGLRTLVFIGMFFFYPDGFYYRAVEIVPLSLIFLVGIRVWVRGYRPARFFVVAYGLLFVSFFIKALVTSGVVPFGIVAHYSLHFGFILEMLLLSFALGDQVRILRHTKTQAQRRVIYQQAVNAQLKDQVNRELEEKISQRTQALDQKNAQLAEVIDLLNRQTHEINQINSVLDLENWKLKNNLKATLKNRLEHRVLPYADVQKIFPDTLACYRYLAEIKEKNGFRCRKCGNEKHGPGAQKFARRCTRCGYHESVTANTLFHGLKFPIEKAFYLAYLAVHRHDHIRLDTLAEMLDLHRNTVWAFQQRLRKHLRAALPTRATQQAPLLDFEEAIRLNQHTACAPAAKAGAVRD